jgi:hypothetical protein
VVAPGPPSYIWRNDDPNLQERQMFAMTQKIGPLAETLRMIRATIRRLTLVTTSEPAPYWADYLRETRQRGR